MGWTAKMRSNRSSKSFNSRGEYRGKIFTNIYIQNKESTSKDTENRDRIVEEITKRIKEGEILEEITEEIAKREEVKEQFNYYIKNGITDLSRIFANWYRGRQKNGKNCITNETR